MSQSDDIKVLLNSVYGNADWKRLSKQRLNSEFEFREFKEPKSGTVIAAYTWIESKETQLYNGSKIIFGIAQSEEDLIVKFDEPFYFRSGNESHITADFLSLIGKTRPAYLRETDDGEFVCHAGLHSRDQLVADLIAGGFAFDLELSNDINEDYGGPVYGKPTAVAAMAQKASVTYNVNIEDDDDDFNAKYRNSTIFFGVYDSAQTDNGGEGMAVSFAPKEFWNQNGYIPDWHMQDFIESRFTLPNYISGEDMENTFGIWEDGMDFSHMYPPTVTKAQVIKDLKAAGLVFSQELDDMLNDTGHNDEDETANEQ